MIARRDETVRVKSVDFSLVFRVYSPSIPQIERSKCIASTGRALCVLLANHQWLRLNGMEKNGDPCLPTMFRSHPGLYTALSPDRRGVNDADRCTTRIVERVVRDVQFARHSIQMLQPDQIASHRQLVFFLGHPRSSLRVFPFVPREPSRRGNSPRGSAVQSGRVDRATAVHF